MSLSQKLNIPARQAYLLLSLVLVGIAAFASLSTKGANLAAGKAPDLKESFASAPKTTAELVGAIVAAYGGPAKIKEVKDAPYKNHAHICSFSAISGASNCFDCDIVGKGDKVRMETVLIGQKTIIGYDGKKCWSQIGDWIAPSPETTAKEISEELRHSFNELFDLASPDCKPSYAGNTVINGKPCQILKIIAQDGKPTTFFADAKSHLIVRSQYTGTDREQNVPALMVTEYSDYRPIDGTMQAFKIVDYSNDKKTQESQIDKASIGLAVPDSVFAMPPESTIAELKRGPITIPFDFERNKIIIKVRLNHLNDYRFVVDTGASQTLLDTSVAQSVGPVAASNFSITTGAKAVNLNYTTIPSLSLGGVSLDNITALVSDLGPLRGMLGERPAGIIGANVLKRFLVTIDFGNKSIVFSDPRTVTVPEGAFVLQTAPIFSETALVVKGKLNDKADLNFLVDTGASFNSLPQSAIKSVLSGPVLAVADISGLDAGKVHIGSIRLSNLRLDGLTVDKPVFVLTPDGSSGQKAAGIFNAQSMGILGMPTWSQYRFSIDYRGERLILEKLPVKEAINRCLDQCNHVYFQFLRTKDMALATKALQKLLDEQSAKPEPALTALIESTRGNCLAQMYADSKNGNYLNEAQTALAQAYGAAEQSHDKEIKARVLAFWAHSFLLVPQSRSTLLQAQGLILRAAELSQTEPNTYAAQAELLLHAGQLKPAGTSSGQALMVDPDNWLALWTEYQIAVKENNAKDKKMVALLLKRYYPDQPAVIALFNNPRRSK